jgi:hypothetical protein
MANFIDVSGLTYCGKEYQNIFARDMYTLDLRNYGITLMDGVKGKMKLYTGEIGDVWQAYSCPFTPQGAASLAESFIEPVAIKSNLENCYDTFWNTFLVEQTSISLNGGIPQTFAAWFFDKYRQKMAREYEEIFWQGDTARTATTKAYLKVTDGVEKQLSGNSAVTSVALTAFTVDNILAQVETVISSGLSVANAAEVDTGKYKVLMNKADVDLLKMALGKVCCPNNNSIFSNYAKGADGGVIILGYEVIPTMQSRNTIIFGDPRNLVLGFDTFDSHLSWKLIDLRDTTGDNMFRIIAISNIAVGVVFPEGMVYASV